MYLRFAITEIDEDSRRPKGVFIAAHSLLNSGDLDKNEWQQVRELLDWFNQNLPAPPKKFYASRAVFWFKSTAHESISRVWQLVHLLRFHGYHVTVYKCRRLANVSYADEFQVAAYPSDNDGRVTVQ
jgi:hypothetical protein